MRHSLRKHLPLICILAFLLTPGFAYAITFSGTLIAITGFFLTIATNLFDAAIGLFVLDMGSLINSSIGESIDTVWTIVRDLVNLTFIFGLVYVGFRTILDADSSTKKALASIVVGALLVNFSLFIAKTVVDVSNLAAVEIYNQMDIASNTIQTSEGEYEATISTALMARMGIVNLVAVPNAKGEIAKESRGGDIKDADGYIAFVIGATLFILVAAFVFAAGAILLAIRFGVLILLMMLSPIAFAATVLPGVGKWSKMWWDQLLRQSFFAPAYLFMIYVTLLVGQAYGGETRLLDKIYTNEGGVLSEGFTAAAYFALTIVLLVASLIIAKQMGAVGADFATRNGARLSFGLQAAMSRNTFGRIGHAISESEKLKEAASQGGITGFMAHRALDAGRAAAKGSYDLRIPINKTGLGKLSGLDYGDVNKGGHKKRVEDIAKKEADFAKSLGEDKKRTELVESMHNNLLEEKEAEIEEKETRRAAELSVERELLTGFLRASVDDNKTAEEQRRARINAEIQRNRMEQINDTYNPIIKKLQKERRELEKQKRVAVKAAKNARQLGYGASTKRGILGTGFNGSPTFLITTRGENRAAKEAIDKDVNKSEQDKQTEKITDAFKSSQKES